MKKLCFITIIIIISIGLFADTVTCTFTVTGGDGEEFSYGKVMYSVITNTYYYDTETLVLPNNDYSWSISHSWDPNAVPPLVDVVGWVLIRESTSTIYERELSSHCIVVNIPSLELPPEENND